MESSLTPIYESEMAHRRVLSPRSQIVASSASVFESSDSSSESFISEKFQRNPKKTSKVLSNLVNKTKTYTFFHILGICINIT
jgi:hypothetical protein